MSNLQAPRYVRSAPGAYNADLGNRYGDGLRITIERADEYAAIPFAWVAHVMDWTRREGVRHVETLLLNTYDTKREAQADVAARIADGRLTSKREVRF